MNLGLNHAITAIIILLVILTGTISLSSQDGSTICLTSNNEKESSCNNVQNSEYGKIFGIKVADLGFVAFLSLLALRLLSNPVKRNNYYYLYLAATSIGLIFSIYFISLQLFILNEICSICMLIDSTTILLSILIAIEFSKTRR